jgi:hypothetical protein
VRCEAHSALPLRLGWPSQPSLPGNFTRCRLELCWHQHSETFVPTLSPKKL